MTAYLLTPEQHAQIVDAMTDGRDWAEDALKDYNDKYDDHPACEGGRKIIADSLERLTAALAMLKAMKPVEPVGYTDSRGRFFYKNDPHMIQDHSGMPELYALGDAA